MKKITGKIIAIVLTVTLVFSMTGMAFADSSDMGTVSAKTASFDKTAIEKTKVVNGVAKAKPMGGDIDPLSIKTIATTATTEPDFDEWTMQPNMYGDAIVTAPTSGYIWFDYEVEGTNSKDRVDVYLFKDAYSEEYFVSASGRLCPGDSFSEEGVAYASKGDSYYLYIETPETNTGTITISIRAKMYSNVTNRVLPAYSSSSQYLLASSLNKSGDNTSDLYFKVTPSKTGVMTVNLKAYGETISGGSSTSVATVNLYDANKKLLSDSVTYKSSSDSTKAYFGVTKGKTYYIRVRNCHDADGNIAPKYGIRYSMATATDRNLSSTAKAQKILTGKIYTTLFSATNATSADYYKIYVPKTKTTKFSIDTKKIRSGQVYVRVYKNGKQVGATKIIKPNVTKTIFTVTYGKTTGKATKGTYYIKVSKTAKCSGVYKIKYVQ